VGGWPRELPARCSRLAAYDYHCLDGAAHGPRSCYSEPWFWLLAFVTTYATLGFSAFAGQGVSLISPIVGNAFAIASLMILVFALLSLGRNIGFIPAQRKVVTKGAYGLVRHPIYTGTFVSLFAFVLRSYSALNLPIALLLIALLMVRGVVEEHFLREDPGYAAYLQEVRWPWFPGIA
jgi:protein-S-isoprenylcysteine O-methyltransferase Ste14